MKLEDILKKQKDKGKEIPRLKTSTLSIEDYTRDKGAPRPYNNTFISEPFLTEEESDAGPILDFGLEQEKIEVVPKIIKVKKVVTEKKLVIRRDKDELNYEDLSGNAKLVVDEIISLCLVLGDLTTSFIEKKELCKRLGIKAGSLKTTCVRLKEKNVLDDFETTKGRRSKWKFSLSKKILQQFKNVSIS
jgi:hypothetical protein